MKEGRTMVEMANMGKYNKQFATRSSFNGTVGGCFGVAISIFFIIVFTLGLGTPWAICKFHRWRVSNLVIDGKKVVFYGRGRKLFWRYTGWSILSIITLGFFAFRVPVKIMDWLMDRTHLEREEDQPQEPYYRNIYQSSAFCGVTMDYVRILILQTILLIVTLGLAMPWVICLWGRWYYDNMIIDGKQVVFAGRGKKLFWRYILWSLLSVVTLGVWSFWMTVRILKWKAEYTYFA